MRVINDIRLCGIGSIGRMIEKPGKPFLFGRYNLIGRRYAAKLYSLEFHVGNGGEIFILQFKNDLSHGVVGPDFDGLCRSYSCGVEPTKILEMTESERHDYFASCITKMMLQVSAKENLETEKIRLVDDLILKERENLEVTIASSRFDNWSIRAEYRIGEDSSLSVIAENLDSSRTFKILDLPLDEYEDARLLARTIRIKKSSVSVLSKHGIVAEHMLRRYSERLKILGVECRKRHFEIPLPDPCKI